MAVIPHKLLCIAPKLENFEFAADALCCRGVCVAAQAPKDSTQEVLHLFNMSTFGTWSREETAQMRRKQVM